MASTQTNSTGKNKKLNYEEFEYDVEKMPPALRIGKFKFSIDRVTVGKTKSNGDDKMDFKFKVLETLDDGEDADGRSIFHTHVFYKDPTAPANGFMKRALRQLCEATETDLSEVPKKINPEALEEFAAQMKGKELEAWVVHEENNDEVQARIRFVEPSDGGLSLSGGAASDDDEDEKPKKSTKGKSARR
jgi:hypothetical protein